MTTLERVIQLASVMAGLFLWALIVEKVVKIRDQRKPVAAGWPPPVVWDDAALDRLLTAVLADPWGPPEPWTRQG